MRKPIRQSDFSDPDLRAHGCTIASLAYLAREATKGDAWDDVDAYAATLRERSGVPLVTFRRRGTTLTEAETAYEAAPGFGGRLAPQMRKYRGGRIIEDLMPALWDGGLALVCVDYGTVQDAGRGIGRFRGGHAIVAGDPKGDSVTIADPLRDELVTWKVSLLERAAERFGAKPWGDGRGEFGVVRYAPTLLEDAQARLARAKAALAAARRDRDLAQTTVDELSASLQAANRTIQELRNATPPDCTVAIAQATEAEHARMVALVESEATELVSDLVGRIR